MNKRLYSPIFFKGCLLLFTVLISSCHSYINGDLPLFMEDPSEMSSNKRDSDYLSLMTYNIRHLAAEDGDEADRRVAGIINDVNPDILLIQEIDIQTHRSGGVNQLKRLAELTGLFAASAPSIPLKGGYYGTAVLSAYPILNVERIVFPTPSRLEARSGTLVELDMGEDKSAAVISVHLSYEDPQVQKDQVNHLKDRAISLLESHSLVIIGGDFNALHDSSVMIDFAAAIGREIPEDLPLTFPSVNPDRTIDYLFALSAEETFNERLIVSPAVVLSDPEASDHLPLTMKLPLIDWY